MNRSVQQFLCFSVVGTLGFVVDTAVLYFVAGFMEINPYTGRVVSYIVAATVTWKLNRTFTFEPDATPRLHREWIRYVVVNSIGGGINYAVYAICLSTFIVAREHLVIGVAAGSLSGLVFNFSMSKLFVFKAE